MSNINSNPEKGQIMLPINEVSSIWWDKDKGQILKKARVNKRLSVQAITDQLNAMGRNYTRQSLSAIENGGQNTVPFKLFIDICTVLDLNPSQVVPMITVSAVTSKDFANLT